MGWQAPYDQAPYWMAPPGYQQTIVEQPQVVVSQHQGPQIPAPVMQTAPANPYEYFPQQEIHPATYHPWNGGNEPAQGNEPGNGAKDGGETESDVVAMKKWE